MVSVSTKAAQPSGTLAPGPLPGTNTAVAGTGQPPPGGYPAVPKPSPTPPKKSGAVQPSVTDPQGDSLSMVWTLAATTFVQNGTEYLNCYGSNGPFYPNERMGFCGEYQFYDSVTGFQSTTNNTQADSIYDACGRLVGTGSSFGWHTIDQNYLSTPGVLGSQVFIVPTSGVCWGQWSETYSFTETFTDGQQLTDSLSAVFNVYPVNPAPTTATGVGGGDAAVNNPSPCAGDPVNCASGNFSETYTDLDVPGRGPGLELNRTYNSLTATTRGIFGYGWTSSYELHVSLNGDGSATVTEADGSEVTGQPAGGGAYTLPPWADSTLIQNADGTWTFVRQADLTYTFSSTGQLTMIRDRNGYDVQLTYNGSGQLSTVTDPAGRALVFTFGANGLVSQVADPISQTTNYGYDGSGNLTTVTDPLTHTTSFGYDTNHLLQTATDPRLGVVTNVYDGSGRVTQQTDPAGLPTHFAYSGDNFSPAGGTTTITDPHGGVTVENYTSGVMLSATKGFGTSVAGTWSYGYDPNTFGVTSVTDPNGHTTASTYDGAGNLLTSRDALSRTTSYTYNSLNEPLSATDPAGITTTNIYDAQGNLLSTSVGGIGGAPVANTTYAHTDGQAGDVTEMTDPAGHVTDYTYDSYGDLATKTTHPASGVNNATAFVYDPLGRKVCQASPTATAAGVQCPPLGQPRVAGTTTWIYDADSQLTSETDPLGSITSFVYDGDGNRTQVTDPKGNVTKTVYDLDSRKSSTTVGFGTSAASTTSYGYDVAVGAGACSGSVAGTTYCRTVTDPGSQVTVDYFNARDQQIQETQPSSGTSSSTFDAGGNLSTQTTAGGKATYGYDAADELTSITYANPGTGFAVSPNVSYVYDADGHRTSMTDGTGTTSYSRDTLERVQSTTNGASSVIAYAYDLDNEVTSITYPGRNQAITQTWDGAGRESSVADWLGHTTTFSYDADGNLTTEALPNTTTISSSYDSADELISTKDALNSTPSNPFASLNYTYNADSQVQTESGSGLPAPTSQSYSYDQVDRLTSSSSAAYGYAVSGDPTQLGQASQTFNSAHQLTAQAQTITRVGTASAGDAGTGATLTLTLPNGTAANDQILLAVTLPGSQSIKSTPSGYTAVGTYSSGTGAANVKLALYRRTAAAGDSSVTITFSKTFAKSASLVVYRGVNPTNPIDANSNGTTVSGTSVAVPSITTTKANDQLVLAAGAESASAGSWTAPTGMTTRVNQAGGPTTTGAIADQVLASAGATGSRTATFSITGSLAAALIALQPAQSTYAYDALGDRKTITTPSGTTTLSYNQLAQMTGYGSTTYAYNGDGLRMSKTSGRTTESFVWGSASPDAIPSILVDGSTDYIYGADGRPLEQISGTTVLYYFHDQLGSTRALVGSTGSQVATYTYGAYGGVTASTGTAANPFGFAGGFADSESAFLYLQHRYYDASTAQFVSVDPRVNQTAEAYSYVGGDPINVVDPTGMCKLCSWVASKTVSVVGSAIAVKNTVVREASSPFISVATRQIAYATRVGIGSAAGAAGQLIADSSATLSASARLGRAGVAAASGAIATTVGIAVGGSCELGSIVFTAAATTPVCVVAGVGAAALTNILLGHYVDPAVDSALGWTPQDASGRCT
jgi:RHS repeat-associated protein